MGRRPVGMDELVEHWTVLDDELMLVAGKRGATKLGFALLLKYYTCHGRFARGRVDFPDEVVAFVARQMKVSAREFASYEWSGRSIQYHRAQIREHLGFLCSVQDAEKLTTWLAANVAHAERNPDRVREELLKHCREECIEPPSPERVTRMVRSALHTAEESWFAAIAARLPAEVQSRLLALVTADSTHFRAWDQNLFTEWHSRYGGRGVLVYWHVERGSVVVHSQTLRASASEVAAMVEGAIRHGTTMTVEGNYVDSHGQSEIGFGVTRLLNVDLLPRIKRINRVKLYRPNASEPGAYPNLMPALTRPIRWDVIDANYDQVIKYATAIRTGTASTEAVLARFTRAAAHPAYQAMLEIGRAQRTLFVARYLRDRTLQREIEEGLNVVESWNAANAVIYYGKGGEISSNRREEVEMAALCLRILQASLVYVNTLMLQNVLVEPAWAELFGPADRRGPTPLFWNHVRPYGEIRFDLATRLPLGAAAPSVRAR
ncbi:Tn3 family transposase [Streptomyces sp. NPDC023998]|uniref:Tn3 family transposase n=1 Tax=Streptomyces sp. NPDC023998 TaxID=3154597 RepID=UPI0033EA5328